MLSLLQLLVLLKVGKVLGMVELLDGTILVVELFPMMYLVLVLVIPVVPRPSSQVRELSSTADKLIPLGALDAAVIVQVEQAKEPLGKAFDLAGRDVLVALVE